MVNSSTWLDLKFKTHSFRGGFQILECPGWESLMQFQPLYCGRDDLKFWEGKWQAKGQRATEWFASGLNSGLLNPSPALCFPIASLSLLPHPLPWLSSPSLIKPIISPPPSPSYALHLVHYYPKQGLYISQACHLKPTSMIICWRVPSHTRIMFVAYGLL